MIHGYSQFNYRNRRGLSPGRHVHDHVRTVGERAPREDTRQSKGPGSLSGS